MTWTVEYSATPSHFPWMAESDLGHGQKARVYAHTGWGLKWAIRKHERRVRKAERMTEKYSR